MTSVKTFCVSLETCIIVDAWRYCKGNDGEPEDLLCIHRNSIRSMRASMNSCNVPLDTFKVRQVQHETFLHIPRNIVRLTRASIMITWLIHSQSDILKANEIPA